MKITATLVKYAAIFVIGIAVGWIGTLTIDHIRNMRMTASATTGLFDLRFALEHSSHEIEYGKPMILTDQAGNEYELLFTPSSRERVEYRWKSISDPSRNGSGTVFERYKTVKKSKDGIHVQDAGSDLQVVVGDLQLQWSSGGSSRGWIYYHSDDITVASTGG